jgi:hypothetical protein
MGEKTTHKRKVGDMARKNFLQMMRERRMFPRGSQEWNWRTRAARKYVWLMRGVPVMEWE